MVGLSNFLFLGATIAVAVPAPAATASFCSAVNALVTSAKAQSTASAYCSSFLGIKAQTVTVATTTTIFPPQYTCSPTAAAKRNEGAIEQRDEDAIEKRAASKPSCLKSYTASAVISSACSCLKIPAPSATTVAAATATSATFKIKASYNQQYAISGSITEGSTSNSVIQFTAATFATGGLFMLYTGGSYTCFLESGMPGQLSPAVAYIFPGRSSASTSASDPSISFSNGYSYFASNSGATPVACAINVATGALTCSDTAGSTTTAYNNIWLLGDGTVGTGTGLTAIPA